MKTVYVVQEPDGKNILPAREYGKIHVILSGKEPIGQVPELLHRSLRKYTPDDYLLLVGNPRNIALAFHVALQYSNEVNLLAWQAHSYDYRVEKLNVGDIE